MPELRPSVKYIRPLEIAASIVLEARTPWTRNKEWKVLLSQQFAETSFRSAVDQAAGHALCGQGVAGRR